MADARPAKLRRQPRPLSRPRNLLRDSFGSQVWCHCGVTSDVCGKPAISEFHELPALAVHRPTLDPLPQRVTRHEERASESICPTCFRELAITHALLGRQCLQGQRLPCSTHRVVVVLQLSDLADMERAGASVQPQVQPEGDSEDQLAAGQTISTKLTELPVHLEYEEPEPEAGLLYLVVRRTYSRKRAFVWVNCGGVKSMANTQVRLKYWTHRDRKNLKRRFLWLPEDGMQPWWVLVHICEEGLPSSPEGGSVRKKSPKLRKSSQSDDFDDRLDAEAQTSPAGAVDSAARGCYDDSQHPDTAKISKLVDDIISDAAHANILWSHPLAGQLGLGSQTSFAIANGLLPQQMASSLLRHPLYMGSNMPAIYASPVESPQSSSESTVDDSEENLPKPSIANLGSAVKSAPSTVGVPASVSRKETPAAISNAQSEPSQPSSAFASTRPSTTAAADSGAAFGSDEATPAITELEPAATHESWFPTPHTASASAQPQLPLVNALHRPLGTQFLFPFGALGSSDLVHFPHGSNYIMPFYTGSLDHVHHHASPNPTAPWYHHPLIDPNHSSGLVPHHPFVAPIMPSPQAFAM